MRIPVAILAYREEWMIEKCLRQFNELRDECDVWVILSEKPWRGEAEPMDKTEEIARKWGAQVLKAHWLWEQDQRNALPNLFLNHEFVVVIDSDEFFTKEDWMTIFAHHNKQPTTHLYAPKAIYDYWKTPEWRLDPTRLHRPVIAINPRLYRFYDKREVVPYIERTFIPVTMYHMSYVRRIEDIKRKHETFSHSEDFKSSWYSQWLNWEPGMGIQIPTISEADHAVSDPAPLEIYTLFDS